MRLFAGVPCILVVMRDLMELSALYRAYFWQLERVALCLPFIARKVPIFSLPFANIVNHIVAILNLLKILKD